MILAPGIEFKHSKKRPSFSNEHKLDEDRRDRHGGKDKKPDTGGQDADAADVEDPTTPIPSPTSSTSIMSVAGSSSGVVTSTTASPSTPSPTSSNHTLTFNDPTNTTTCGILALSWTYAGPDLVDLTLQIQKSNQGEASPSSSNASASGSTMPAPTTLTSNVLSDADNYTWSSVNATEGWYIAKAFDTSANIGIEGQSTPFFIAQGDNSTCFPITDNSTSTSHRSPSSQRGRMGVGDIVGLVLGVTAGVICLVVAFLYPRLWRRELPSPKRQRPYLLY